MVDDEDLDMCLACGTRGLTIGGLCPNCGAVKDERQLPEPRKYQFIGNFGEEAAIAAVVLTIAVLLILRKV